MNTETTGPGEVSPGSSSSIARPLQLGVIGCELGRTRYGSALAALPAVKIAGLSDREDRFARIWARELGGKVPVYSETDSLLAQPIDAVIVAVPMRERSEQIAQALRAGRPVLAEMPFALTLSDFDDLIALAEQHSTLLLPALPRRFDGYFQAVAHELDLATIGALQQVRCAWSFPVENVQNEADIVGSGWNVVLQTLACQTVDLCCLWQGAGTTVTADVDLKGIASGRHLAGRRPQEGTLANIIVAHAQGQSTHQITRGRSVQPDERYILTGSDGNMELVVSAGPTAATASAPNLRRQRTGERYETLLPYGQMTEAAGSERETLDLVPVRGKRKETPLSPAVERMRLLLLHFAGCVQTGSSPAVTAADARAAMEIVQAAYVSTMEHAKVTLPLRRSPDITGILNAFSNAPRSLPSA